MYIVIIDRGGSRVGALAAYIYTHRLSLKSTYNVNNVYFTLYFLCKNKGYV